MFPDAAIAGVRGRGMRSRAWGRRGDARGPRAAEPAGDLRPDRSRAAALERGSVHAAVVHDRRDRLPRPAPRDRAWHLAGWQVGLGRAVHRARRASLEALVGGDLPLVQRDRAARSQWAFERALAAAGLGLPPPAADRVRPPGRGAHGGDSGGVAVTTEGAARAFGLGSWRSRSTRSRSGSPSMAQRARRSRRSWNCWADRLSPSRVAQFGGYDLTGCGTLRSGRLVRLTLPMGIGGEGHGPSGAHVVAVSRHARARRRGGECCDAHGGVLGDDWRRRVGRRVAGDRDRAGQQRRRLEHDRAGRRLHLRPDGGQQQLVRAERSAARSRAR